MYDTQRTLSGLAAGVLRSLPATFAPILGLMAALILPVPSADAATTTLATTLIGANEVPPSGSAGTGSAIVTLDTTANTFRVQVTFSGLGSGTTAAHIHCCLAFPFQPNVNVMVATTTPTFPSFPLGVTSGSYDMTFGLLDPASYNSAFISSPVFNPGGTVMSAAGVLVAALLNGQTYLNVHTQNFIGGEIRGFLAPVPPPAALPLFASGLGALGLLGWRRKRKAAGLAA